RLHEPPDEIVADVYDAVDLLLGVHLGEGVRDGLRIVVRRLVDEALPVRRDLVAAETQRRPALAPDDGPHDLASGGALLTLELERTPQHLAVERPGEAAVAAEDDDGDPVLLTALHEREVAERRGGARGADHQLLHAVGVRP